MPDAAAARTIEWSGYTWDVRPAGFGPPGPNHWSDAPANVRTEGTDLVLSIVRDAAGRWTSAEIGNQTHLGYGTYRWVVDSDLRALDSHEVLGMFTYGGDAPSHNEIDFEPSHWGNTAWPGGSATVWQDADAGRNRSRTFDYSGPPPYLHQFTWAPGRIDYLVRNGEGDKLLDWTVTEGVPRPSSEVPRINYWRHQGEAPASVRSMRLKSFTWEPPAPAPEVQVGLTRRRFAVGDGTTIRYRSTGRAKLRLKVQRGKRTVGTISRAVRGGSGQIRFNGKLGGRRLAPGPYRLRQAGDARVRLAPRQLRFTVVAR
ncbi:MAG TPA: glycoside hydrolase family 16 protein [Solirubrobacter sp.]|nr:glycoside hydrolase family 16 protein [Solirubrobacter sp.]